MGKDRVRELESYNEELIRDNNQLRDTIDELEEFITRAFDIKRKSQTIEALSGMTIEQVAEGFRDGKFDPKEELPVIPKYMADFIKVRKYTDAYSLQYIFCVAMERSEDERLKKEYDWISANDETFARAWLDGYEVEEEPKYYVDLDTVAYVAKWIVNDEVDIYTDTISGNDEFEFHLTEQEIKDYDDRYWAFAKPVEGDK